MCRLLGYVSATPTTLEKLIGPEQCTLFRSMGRLHADGSGSAWLNETTGSIDRVRDAMPAQETESMADVLSVTPSRARIVHLRMATNGLPVNILNSHPFLAGDLAFAHNGAIKPVKRLRSLLAPAMLEEIRGQTDSELYFALIRQGVAEGRSLFEATCDTVETLRATFPGVSLNALLLAPDQLIAVHSSEASRIPHREFEASGIHSDDLPLDHLDAYYQMSYLRGPDGSTVFSSSGIDTTGWTPLPPATVASVDLRTRQLTTRSLLDWTAASTV